jgi:1,4-dihydroxy-2-naphthoate octaprenyltransferase
MSNIKYFLGWIRLPFLVLAPVCVLAGIAGAYWTASSGFSALPIFLTFVGGVAAHVSVNSLNEYFDFRSGLDFKTQRTPFSGGSGTLPTNPEKARGALVTGLASLALAGLIGLYFTWQQGLWMLPLGVLGIIVILTYTPWLNRNVWLCLVAPGLGFGTLMVMGTYFALKGEYSWTSFFISLTPFFLVSNLLLLNQFPDVEADRSIGRRTLPIQAGRKIAAVVYIVFLGLTYLSTILGVALGFLPVWALLELAALIVAVPLAIRVYRFADQIDQLIPAMGLNVIVNLLSPVLLAIGLFLG